MKSRTSSTLAMFAMCNAVAAVTAALVALNACAQVPTTPYQRAGTSEAELKMQRRMIEIAEGRPPSLEMLEAEFGLKYQKNPSSSEFIKDHIATGRFPFTLGYSSFYQHFLPGKSPSIYLISFNFMTNEQLRADGRSFCVVQDDLAASLIKRGWEHRKIRWQPHGIREEDYSKNLGGYSRTVNFFPLFVGCINSISIRFAELPLTSLPDSPASSTKPQGDQK